MAEEERGTARGLIIGSMGGAALASIIAALIATRPGKAVPPDEKIDYLIECQTAIVQLLQLLAEGNQAITQLLQQLVDAAGVPTEIPRVKVAIHTPWEAKEPEEIFSQAIKTAEAFYTDKMVNWTQGKRLTIKVESSLDQDCDIQLIGNIADTRERAVDVGDVLPCPANSNISAGLAFDNWHPYIGARITTAIAPTAGILTITAVIQE